MKQGWCWWYQKYAPGDMVLEGLKREAREAKKGLWVDPAHVPPWEWRCSHGGMVVTYLSRVSTDQVTGFGSSAKRPVVRALMGSYVKDMLESLRAKAEKP